MNFTAALDAAEGYRDAAKAALVARLSKRSIEADQRAAHGFAWVATSVAALGAVHRWLDSNGGGTQLDQQIASLIFTETLGQLTGGLPMGQNEIFRPVDLGINNAAQSLAKACITPNLTLSVTNIGGLRQARYCHMPINGISRMTLFQMQPSPTWPRLALLACASPLNMAVWDYPSWSCVLLQKSYPAAGLAQVRLARDQKSRAN